MPAILNLLRIKNLALVEELEWQIAPGFTAITGETGAGKSIIIGALQLLLGERADKSLIRTGADTCRAEAIFTGEELQKLNPQLIEAGVTLIEQPVAKWNVEALKTLTATLGDRASIMADETVCTPQDAMLLARSQACHVFSLKVAKHGGLLRTRQVAAVAEAADIGWYGGTMLETSIGSAASAHLFSTLGTQHHGCELFGPQLLVDDIVTERMPIRDFELELPDGPGFGVEVDMAQLNRFDRARTGLTQVHIDLGQRAVTI